MFYVDLISAVVLRLKILACICRTAGSTALTVWENGVLHSTCTELPHNRWSKQLPVLNVNEPIPEKKLALLAEFSYIIIHTAKKKKKNLVILTQV